MLFTSGNLDRLLMNGSIHVDDDDETEAWISSNRDRSEEEYKPVISVATSSLSWCEGAYEKPSLVV